jgi:hypothetical protein
VATKLTLYNDALMLLGERFLSALNEDREPRRLLDRAWDSGAVRACLAAGQWNFAMRSQMFDYDPGIQPDFGYQRGFEKPTDWVVTSSLCQDEHHTLPLLRYVDEAGYWYADIDTIFVRYVSDDAGYGNNLAEWPESFSDFVAAHLAWRISPKVKDVDAMKDYGRIRRDALLHAKNVCAMSGPTSFPAQGAWSMARHRRPNRRDGGNRGGLIG